MHIQEVIFIITSFLVLRCLSACSRRGVECPDYQIVGRHQGYEERLYQSTTWISTAMESHSLSDAKEVMYKKLFSYIKGNNLKGVSVNTTTPVRIRIVPCHGATCATTFIMSVLMPADMEDSTPYPNDPALFIEKDPSVRYVVKMFEGRPSDIDWIEQAHLLAQQVKKDNSVDKSYYYISWYDPPYQLYHRLNEIWMVKKEQTTPPPVVGNESVSVEKAVF